MDNSEEAYRRGLAAGEVTAKLAQHEAHLATINGSIEGLRHEMGSLTGEVHSLRDELAGREANAEAAASALRNADDARRSEAEMSWGRFQRVFAIIATVAALITIASVLITFLH